jgi:Lanthionine synthetase C-like protein
LGKISLCTKNYQLLSVTCGMVSVVHMHTLIFYQGPYIHTYYYSKVYLFYGTVCTVVELLMWGEIQNPNTTARMSQKRTKLAGNMDYDSRYYHPTLLAQPCPNWSTSQYTQMAEQIMGRCLNHYRRQPRRSAGSLYVGALGSLVFLRFRMAQHFCDTDKNKAAKLLRDALEVSEESLRHEGPYRVSLLEGAWFGAKALQCAILYRMDKAKESQNHARELLNALEEECQALPASECEVLYGRAGALQVIWFLREQLQDKSL